MEEHAISGTARDHSTHPSTDSLVLSKQAMSERQLGSRRRGSDGEESHCPTVLASELDHVGSISDGNDTEAPCCRDSSTQLGWSRISFHFNALVIAIFRSWRTRSKTSQHSAADSSCSQLRTYPKAKQGKLGGSSLLLLATTQYFDRILSCAPYSTLHKTSCSNHVLEVLRTKAGN